MRIQAVFFVAATVSWSIAAWRMDGMAMGPWTELGSFGSFVILWIAMTAAMMLPSTAPAAALYGQMRAGRGHIPSGLAGFAIGYLAVWTAVGGALFGIDLLVRLLPGDPLAWGDGGRWIAAGALGLAAVWEATPLKKLCLVHCRNPAGVLTRSWRDGVWGALVLGGRIGGWCVASCWGLMLALFALGLMSLAWMAVVTLVIAIQRIAPWPRASAWAAAGLLTVIALGVAVAPGAVPGLVPAGGNGAGGMPAMHAMPAGLSHSHDTSGG